MGSVDTTNMVGSPFWIPPEMVQKKEHGTPVSFIGFCFIFSSTLY